MLNTKIIEISKDKRIKEWSGTKKSFLEIIRKNTDEGVLSNLYSFFLEPSENHGCGNQLLEALKEIVYLKSGKKLVASEWKITREANTSLGNKIDILIEGISRNNDKCAFIIENKIFHVLNNDLNDYWNSVKIKEDNKVGIILGISNLSLPQKVRGNFFFISHIELFTLFKKKLLSIGALDANIYLFEFERIIRNISRNQIMSEEIKFYFDNPQEIDYLATLKRKAESAIELEFKVVEEALKVKSEPNIKQRWVAFDISGMKNIYYIVTFDKLFKGDKKIKICIEINSKHFKNLPLFESILKETLLSKKYLISSYPTDYQSEGFLHLVSKEYTLAEEELENFGVYIAEKISSEFQPIMDRLSYVVKL